MVKKKNLLILLTYMMAAMIIVSLTSCGGDNEDPINDPVNQKPGNNGGSDTPTGTLTLTRTCSTCEGSAKCTTCNGTGKGCQTCKGTGQYCWNCGTTGLCSDCGGTGDCYKCNNTGEEDCHTCFGDGNCIHCHGKGYIIGVTDECPSCRSNPGKCSSCNGSGKETCSWCYGLRRCPSCEGSKICQTCKGNPTCKTCGGDGHCQACTNSDGKCKDCTGTGEVSLSSLIFADSGGNESVIIHSTAEWQVSADADWLTFSRTSGSGDYTLTVTAAKNNVVSARNGTITFSCGSSKTNVSVSQSGEPAKLSIDVSSVFVSSSGSGATINITSNTSWTVRAADSWVTCTPSSGTGNAAISVSAPAHSGTRYSTLTFADTSGELSFEISVAQAESVEALTALRNWLEKPMGIVDVDMKTASYQTIKYAVERLYKIEDYPDYDPLFIVKASDNPNLGALKYQGLQFDYAQIGKVTNGRKYVIYGFKIDKSTASNNYQSYLNNIIEDFMHNLDVTLKINQYMRYTAKGTDFYSHEVCVSTYTDYYSFSIATWYK